ncbi:hypothetical protein HK099_000527 [Clydaea vesicula]|uniref:DNA-directed RNA polymerase subunit beta n=1 Tax=Clydaea vesicula TaxID=447962 RepID=A0AAD5XXE6_9FUNG|nr:hypothetical protein HK099_000527 [Clydaea vesicula]
MTQFNTLENVARSINPSNTETHFPKLASLSQPHIQSFNNIFDSKSNLLNESLSLIKKNKYLVNSDGTSIHCKVNLLFSFLITCAVWFEKIFIGKPIIEGVKSAKVVPLYPSECRERGISYKSKLSAKFCWKVNDGPIQVEQKALGYVPILVKSTKCNLEGKSPSELIKHREDPEEFGGYFIVNGIERLIRLLIVPRRNHVIGIIRSSFANRGPTFTPFGTQIRCVRKDESSQTNALNYCRDGSIFFRFSYRKQEFLIPVVLILRALTNLSTDIDIFESLTAGSNLKNSYLTDRIELLLRNSSGVLGLPTTRKSALEYLGSKFHVLLDSKQDLTQEEVGEELLKEVVLVHLNNNRDKFELLMSLYALSAGECAEDNPDSPQHQEILLGGHLYSNYMKEKFNDILDSFKTQIKIDQRKTPAIVNFQDKKYILKTLGKINTDIGRKMEYFLATGNLVSNTGLDLQQTSGYTVVAEKLNFYRYLSHFRSVHRGSFFAELKTTTVRKLLPESWGFLCPVHTPDGSPCGLLNHLSHNCKIITTPLDCSKLAGLISSFPGVSSILTKPKFDENDVDAILSIQLDGKIVGWCNDTTGIKIAQQLRSWKVENGKGVPLDLEIGLVLPTNAGQYPGLFLFSSLSRMMRPVKYLLTSSTDSVGTFEQVYMNIACMKEDIVPGITTHQDFAPTDILSVVANLTPFSDFNQSPRNMYQCQMGKQSMGTPAINLPHRTDNKLYRLQTGQTPVVRPKLHDTYGMDGYPNGMNAVIAVISYTGYDMEDASIINKGSHDRGYGYGTIYKSEFINLAEKRIKGEPITKFFGLISSGSGLSKEKLEKYKEHLDTDGLPHIGVKMSNGDPLYAIVDDVTGKVEIKKYKSMEESYVEEIRLIGNDQGNEPLQKIHIKFRIRRPPVVGDKFSSRHGQKGVISQKWPIIDMPFCESGIVPDIIINPHAFPSRMTIGMIIESLAGKAGALHGVAQDSTPFTFNEDNPASEHFGEQLKAAGYNYHGNEPMYSGITGKEFKADIYIGVVYYQRLRHMVSDKYQVRTTGPVHNLTQQPIKGRKRAGGIRFGEMERDSLLAHGVSFCLQDRLMNCSDYSQAHCCIKCGTILSLVTQKKNSTLTEKNLISCLICGEGKDVDVIAIPFVFRYLCTELTAMNVKLKLEF